MRLPLRHAVLVLACAVPAAGQALVDNDQVRVLKVTEQPHNKTRPHEHKVNRVMIYLTTGRQEFVEGDKKSYLEFKAGQPLWSPARGTHTAEVVSASPVTIVEVELKKSGDSAKTATGPLDPVMVDPLHYRLEFENAQARVVHVRIPAGESAPLHEHKLNRVVVYLTDQKVAVTTDGKTELTEHKAGDISTAGPAKHSEKNVAGGTFEAVVVELKD